MRFFVIFFLVLTAICAYFWLTDPAGSGMGYATLISALLLLGVLVYNKIWRGGWLSDSAITRK